MILELGVFSVVLVFLFVKWILKDINFWAEQGVPFLKPKFPFGNVGDIVMMKKTTGECYMDIYRKFEGEAAGGFFKLFTPSLVLRDPDLVKTILVKEFSKFNKNQFDVSRRVDPLMAINPFAVGELNEWKKVRTIQLPSLTLSRVQGMVPDLMDCVHNLINFIRQNNGNALEIKELMSGYTSDTVASCAFGLKLNSFVENGSPFHDASGGEIFRSSWIDNMAVVCAMYAPIINNVLGLRIISKSVEGLFIKSIKDVVEFRKTNGVRKNDLVQLMIDKNASKPDDQPEYDEVEMAAHCMTFYMDAYETTAIQISFILHELAMNPDIQQQVRNEILNISTNIQDFDHPSIQRLEYFDNVISECLRLHPPIQQLVRTCTADTTVTSGGKQYKFRAGMSAVVPIYGLHMDPENFPEPEVFNPKRFAKENRHLIRKFTYLPFGEGPRMCVGMRFARSQMKLAIAAILLEFRVLPEKELPGKLTLDPMSTFLHTAKDGVWLKFEKL